MPISCHNSNLNVILVLRLLGQRWGRRGELWGHGIFTAEIVRFRFLCACLGLIKRKSSRRFLFTMFEQAVSSSLHELGLVSLEREQRQAVETIVVMYSILMRIKAHGYRNTHKCACSLMPLAGQIHHNSSPLRPVSPKL